MRRAGKRGGPSIELTDPKLFSGRVGTGLSRYRIERRDQCGFSRHGSVQLYGVDEMRRSILSSDHIVRVQKL